MATVESNKGSFVFLGDTEEKKEEKERKDEGRDL